MKKLIHFLLILQVMLIGIHHAIAQNTVFTYQGKVTDAGTNFTGFGQFEFALVTSSNLNKEATATAIMGGSSPHEFVNGFTLITGGSGYSSAPTVTISGGGGSGALAQATLTGGSVSGISVINPGSGYTSTPTVIIASPSPDISYVTYWSNDGTSNAGSEPASAVNIAVTNGLFTIVLGDNSIPNMSAISVALFNQPNLQLRIWFNDGVNGFAVLSPVQSLTPAPYATVATVALTAGNLPGLNVQQNTSGAPNVIGGASVNSVASGVVGATIAGGGATNTSDFFPNSATNSVTADFGTVSGGAINTASGFLATVGGGFTNTASGPVATVGGGQGNIANGPEATVPGGVDNLANGAHSFAAGTDAQALHDGAFVWADDHLSAYASDRDNQFKIRAGGGVQMDVASSSGLNPAAVTINSTSGNGIGLLINENSSDTSGLFVNNGTGDIIKGFSGNGNTVVIAHNMTLSSDRNVKENFKPLDAQIILEKVAALPLTEWNYKSDSKEVQHIGPMAQDFQAAFQLDGKDDKHISVVDEGGVALAAIQGLNQKLQMELNHQDAENAQLKQQLAELKQMVLNLSDKKN
jgi:Chaperone of endosialidase